MNAFDTLLTGKCPEFQAILRAAQVVAATDVTVLIEGESGTGKELLARALHRSSRRSSAPFVTINCAALPEGLTESELFGHRKGAFTGATSEHAGRIRAADGGTLFLDEIGELALGAQAKLLRFLESGECQAVGHNRATRVDVRVVAATNRDLLGAVKTGGFREDLFYRLNVVPLALPPLRQRHGDIPLLLGSLTSQLAHRHGLDAPRFSVPAVEALQRYAWPGNVRELRNVCERLLVLFPGRNIQPENLPAEVRQRAPGDSVPAGFALPEGGLNLEALEINMIRQALTRASGNRSKAARLLGLTRNTLLYRLKKYALR